MDLILKFLIYTLNEPNFKKLNSKNKHLREQNLSSDQMKLYILKNLFFKYKLMRIRIKLSYHAFCLDLNVTELFLK